VPSPETVGMNRRILSLIGIVGIVVALGGTVAFARMMTPPADLDLATEQPSTQQLFYVAYASSTTPPPVNQLHTWTIRVTSPSGEPIDGATIAVDGDMPQHGHGLPTQPRVTQALGNGEYLVEGMKFQMGGWWIVDFTIDVNGASDTVRFNLSL
jgi:YtkA-like